MPFRRPLPPPSLSSAHRYSRRVGTVSVSGPPPTPTPAPAQPLNVSTRLRVQTGDNVLIGGFIISGNASKKVIIRAIGASLSNFGITGALADPMVSLNGSGGNIATNDNWKDTQQAAIEASDVAPADDHEAAIVATLAPGGYTAIVQGKDQTTGIGLVEVYDLDASADAKLATKSPRRVRRRHRKEFASRRAGSEIARSWRDAEECTSDAQTLHREASN